MMLIAVPAAVQPLRFAADRPQPAGTSIVIHEGEDDYKTDPAGNSGSRIACGVVRGI